jgi:hypothetical protein
MMETKVLIAEEKWNREVCQPLKENIEAIARSAVHALDVAHKLFLNHCAGQQWDPRDVDKYFAAMTMVLVEANINPGEVYISGNLTWLHDRLWMVESGDYSDPD